MAETTQQPLAAAYYKRAVCGGLEALSAQRHQQSFPAHFHPTFNISLVYEGSFHSRLRDRLVIAPPGSIVITNPLEVHANPFRDGLALDFFTFYVNPEFFKFSHGNGPVAFHDKAISDSGLFLALHRLSTGLATGTHSIDWEANFAASLHLLAARHASGLYEPPPATHRLFAELLSRDHFEKFSVAAAAKRFGMNKFKFIRLFKYYTGLTPANYFIHRRIEKSKPLLMQGAELLRVAAELGFYDAAHFSHHFKKFTGVTPASYAAGA